MKEGDKVTRKSSPADGEGRVTQVTSRWASVVWNNGAVSATNKDLLKVVTEK